MQQPHDLVDSGYMMWHKSDALPAAPPLANPNARLLPFANAGAAPRIVAPVEPALSSSFRPHETPRK